MTQSPPKTAEEIAQDLLQWRGAQDQMPSITDMLVKAIKEAEARGRAALTSSKSAQQLLVSDDELEKLAKHLLTVELPKAKKAMLEYRTAGRINRDDWEAGFATGYMHACERNYEQALITKTPDCVITWPSEIDLIEPISQAWCEPETYRKEMDVVLAMAIARKVSNWLKARVSK